MAGPRFDRAAPGPESARQEPGQLDALLSMSPDPVVLLDRTGRISGWNLAAEELFGWSPADVMGERLSARILEDDGSRIESAWRQLTAHEPEAEFLAVALSRGGRRFDVLVRLARVGAELEPEAGVLMLRARPGAEPDFRRSLAPGRPAVPADADVILLDQDAAVAEDLRVGLTVGQLRLHFQPIIELTNHALWGVEALVRWDRPGIGLVPPADFIELAERTGQILELGSWVMREACLVAADLATRNRVPFRVSINLSARQLGDRGVLDMMRSALASSGCPPGLIEIEVTETALMQDLALARDVLHAIKAMGLGLALDDFGTGYSSLVYLKHFPVDLIKIDRSFISGLGVDPDDTAIVTSTIALAHSLGIRCVAEGVETEEQLDLLREMQCDYGQGYLISRPLTTAALQSWRPPRLPDTAAGAQSPRIATRPPHAGRILQMHGQGISLESIAAALNSEGMRTERGLRWSAGSVARVIAKSHYPGIPLA
jgi:PAS domain S-box-containing protein